MSWGCCCLWEQGQAPAAVGSSLVAASRTSPPLLFCRVGFLLGQSLPDSLGDQSSPSRRRGSVVWGSRAEPGLGSLRRRPHNWSATLLPAGLRLCPSWLLRKRRLDDVACLDSAGGYSERRAVMWGCRAGSTSLQDTAGLLWCLHEEVWYEGESQVRIFRLLAAKTNELEEEGR